MIGYDTFLPMNKFIPKDQIPDPHNVRLQLTVNDKVVQDDNTELMLFKIPELLEAITDVMALQEGDIILSLIFCLFLLMGSRNTEGSRTGR